MKNNKTGSYLFDFNDAIERFKLQEWDIEDFCFDEMLGYFLLNHKTVIDTQENRHI